MALCKRCSDLAQRFLIFQFWDMKAVSKYKSIIQELNFIFANLVKEHISLALLQKEQVKVMHYANRIADQIKEELIGDGKEAEYKGRLKTAFFELGLDPNLLHYYNTPDFDFATIYKDEATDVKTCLEEMALWANDMVQDVCSMLDEVCSFVGYTPEPQQKDLHYYCLKAIEKGYLVKKDGGYRRTKEWTKALLAYFLKHFPNTDGTFPDKEYCVMFGESRLSKAADQLTMNKNGNGKPRGYEIVDELLQE